MKLILCSLGFSAVLFGQAPQGSIIPGGLPSSAIPSTTNLLAGDGSGNAVDSTIAPAAVGLKASALSQFAATTSAQLAGVVSDESGNGALLFQNGALGTPVSGVATNLTGLPISTGVSGLGTGVATFLGTPSSANLASTVTDETGSGSLVFGTNPTGSGTATWPRFISPNVALTDNGTTIATDASLSNNFRIGALTANVTLSNPTNSTDGQVATWEVIQNATAAKTLAFGTNFGFGAEITACTISAGLSSHSFITAAYNSTTTKWYVRGCITGY